MVVTGEAKVVAERLLELEAEADVDEFVVVTASLDQWPSPRKLRGASRSLAPCNLRSWSPIGTSHIHREPGLEPTAERLMASVDATLPENLLLGAAAQSSGRSSSRKQAARQVHCTSPGNLADDSDQWNSSLARRASRSRRMPGSMHGALAWK
jgi:hypothetical protein